MDDVQGAPNCVPRTLSDVEVPTLKRPLCMVIVSFVDDNFGDNLIRITFQALLEVALSNHGLAADDYEIVPMPLKTVDEDLLGRADVVFFAGGGLFGLSYLGFYPHVDQITALADRRGIPVIFSSMGINNMGDEGGRADSVAEIITRSCVKSLSVRENLALFQRAAETTPLEVTQVADPAVWTKYVYGMTDIVPDGTLGINVVRGGLFAANDRQWGLTSEMAYLAGLRDLAADAGITTQLYTNGSLDDNNTLRYFAQERGVPVGDVILPQTTREVVEAIASRSMIASIRMHSSIIAYSFGIPTVALQWNDKLPHFYDAIGHPERLIPFGEWTAERTFDALRTAGVAAQTGEHYRSYLMSTYDVIHQSVGEHVLKRDHTDGARFSFDEVTSLLTQRAHRIDETEFDLRVKLGKAERAYLTRFTRLRANATEIRALRKKRDASDDQIAELRRRIATLDSAIETRGQELADERRQTLTLEAQLSSQAAELDDLRHQLEELGAANDSLAATVAAQRRELDRRLTARLARFLGQSRP